MVNFDLEPEEFMTLDLVNFTQDELKDLSYFLWAAFMDDAVLMEWRRTQLLPLIKGSDE